MMIEKGKQGFRLKVGRKKLTSYEWTLLMLVLPFVLFIVAFSFVPLLGWSMAFVKYSPGLSIFSSKFVGLANFAKIFTFSSEFPQVMLNTLALSFLSIAASPLAIILAIAVTELRSKKYQRIVQTVTSLPNFISWVIVYGIAFSFFSVDDGLVNRMLLALHLVKDPPNVLGNNSIVWFFQTGLSIWKYTGWGAIIYFGAICGIDREQYEAAQIDGAGRFQQIWHITLPGIMPTFVILLLLSVGSLLGGASFEQIYVFHNQLVHKNIQTLDYYVYIMGIKRFDFSFSTAVGIFKTVVSVLLLFSCNALAKKISGRSIV